MGARLSLLKPMRGEDCFLATFIHVYQVQTRIKCLIIYGLEPPKFPQLRDNKLKWPSCLGAWDAWVCPIRKALIPVTDQWAAGKCGDHSALASCLDPGTLNVWDARIIRRSKVSLTIDLSDRRRTRYLFFFSCRNKRIEKSSIITGKFWWRFANLCHNFEYTRSAFFRSGLSPALARPAPSQSQNMLFLSPSPQMNFEFVKTEINIDKSHFCFSWWIWSVIDDRWFN